MSKLSYQKLKEENARLKSDIYKLVMEPETLDGIGVRFIWETKFGMANVALSGSRGKPNADGTFTIGRIFNPNNPINQVS
jgi:hypothetical protein